MKTPLLVLSLLGAASVTGLLGGCVYYNGMYNANRLARSARKAEREGRTFDANSLWGQVATKAESVLVRHPSSKYAGQAGLLRGIALARLGQCDEAIGPLNQLAVIHATSELTEDALLATGRCQIALGNLPAGEAAFSQLLGSKNKDRRREAQFQHARLLRQTGQYQAALSALSGIDEPRAETERVLALTGAGRLPEALALTDSLIARGDTTKLWDSLVVILAQEDPSAASSLVDRVRRLPSRTPELRVRMLLEDGLRLATIDTARATRRFRETMAAGGTGEAAGRAGLALVKLNLTRVRDPAELVAVRDTLKGLALRFEIASEEITRFAATVIEVHAAAMSVTPQTPQGDLRLFLAAESAREVLDAPRLAETIFRRISEQWPLSPYAPKAILAAQQLNPDWADSARTLLDEQYSGSPYLATVRGYDSPEYRQLEDSLGAFAASLVVTRPGGARRQPVRTVRPERRPPQ
jgi:tetratricopeptide (TPR) repeat protein